MLQITVLVFVAMLVIVSAMAIGVVMGREPIKGSCGGIAALGLGDCEICGGKPELCEATQSNSEARSDGDWYRAD